MKIKKDNPIIIRCSKTAISFANTGKKNNVSDFIDEYLKICQRFVDVLWVIQENSKKKTIPKLIPKEITDKIETWLSARAVQCCAKQASGIVRGTIKKYKQQLFKLKELMRNGSNAKKLQRKLAKTKLSKPQLKTISPELDSRFVEIFNSDNSFDMWVKLTSIGNKIKIVIPVKKTKHYNKMIANGYKLKDGIRLSKTDITFNFEKPRTSVKTGSTIGIDMGIANSWSSSTGATSLKDNHGHDLVSIQSKLARRKKGSVGFRKAQQHRTNYINWSINQLNLSGIKKINIEDIKDIRRYKKNNRFMNHWAYPEIKSKLERFCEEQGVLVCKVDPMFTSQRCSFCGWTHKNNRKGKTFICEKCDFKCDSDINASQNIVLSLVLTKNQRCCKNGFYWYSCSQESTVPDVQKRNKFL